jgi:hypothetical protein
MNTEMSGVSIKGVTGPPAAKATPLVAKPLIHPPQAAKQAVSIPVGRPPLVASYQYNKAISQVVVTLQRPDTGEVVAQIPPEQVVNFVTAMVEALRNMDAKA